MSESPKGALIVFLKNPETCQIKTRIAATTGPAIAKSIYQVLTTLTLATVKASGIRSYLFYEGGLPAAKVEDPHISYHVQSSGDLGQRMQNALEFALQYHSGAVLIGSDCPDISTAMVKQALQQLDHHDLVLGPAVDGGYYLLGCKQIHPPLFDQIHWSSEKVLDQTLKKADAAHLSHVLLETLEDIDTEEDWKRYLCQSGI